MTKLESLSHKEAKEYSFRWTIERLVRSGLFSVVFLVALYYVFIGFFNYHLGQENDLQILKYAAYGSFAVAIIAITLGIWIFITFDPLAVKFSCFIYGFLASANVFFLVFHGVKKEYLSFSIVGILLLASALAKAKSVQKGLEDLKAISIDDDYYNSEFKPAMILITNGRNGTISLEMNGRKINAALFNNYSIFLKPKEIVATGLKPPESFVFSKEDFSISIIKTTRKKIIADIKAGEAEFNRVKMSEETLRLLEKWKSKEPESVSSALVLQVSPS